MFHCSHTFSSNSKCIYTIYNDNLSYCWKESVFHTAACLLTIQTEHNHAIYHTKLFLTRMSQNFPFRLYSLHATFKTKRKKDISYSFLPHQKLYFKRGMSWVIYSHTVGIVENRKVCFTFFFSQRELFTKTRLTSFRPFPQSNGFKPLMQKMRKRCLNSQI